MAKLRDSFYVSAKEAAKSNKISYTFMRWLIARKRVTGAYRLGSYWAIPSTWKYVKRKRKKKPKPEKLHDVSKDPTPILANQDPSIHNEKAYNQILRFSNRGMGLEWLSNKFKMKKNEIFKILNKKGRK